LPKLDAYQAVDGCHAYDGALMAAVFFSCGHSISARGTPHEDPGHQSPIGLVGLGQKIQAHQPDHRPDDLQRHRAFIGVGRICNAVSIFVFPHLPGEAFPAIRLYCV
jgi:hypothetical protein